MLIREWEKDSVPPNRIWKLLNKSLIQMVMGKSLTKISNSSLFVYWPGRPQLQVLLEVEQVLMRVMYKVVME